MRQVHSSNLAAVEYSRTRKILTIVFNHAGEVYQYYSVPRSVYTGLMSADSKGRFFDSKIRYQFQYRRVNDASSK